MSDENTILYREKEVVRDLQLTIRRELDRRQKPMKAVSYDSQIGYSTLLTYFPEDAKPAELSIAALRLLLKAVPSDVLSILLPDGWQIVRADEGLDHDKIEDLCRDYVATKARAHHKDSPAGREISDCEREALNVAYLPLKGKVA